jgi:hypothetical protein
LENKNEINTTKQDSIENESPKRKRTVKSIRKFPYYSIEETSKIPNLIKQNNGGNPWDTKQLSIALNVKKGTNAFYYMTAASRDYGFTIGTRETDTVELADLGRKLVYAQSQEEIDECNKTAFFNIEIFKKVYDYYKDNEPADDTFFKNALFATFNIEECFHDDFIKIYRENVKYTRKSPSSSTSLAVINNPPSKTSKPSAINNKIFVIMPFSEKTDKYPLGFFNEVFKQLINKSAEEAGFIAETANRDGSDIIHSTIVKAIYSANIILADLTEHNPNVLFELGIAIALKKPVVLIKTECTGQIFDIDNTIRVFSYNQNLWPSTLEKDIPNLSKCIKSVLDNIGKDKSYFDTFMGNA